MTIRGGEAGLVVTSGAPTLIENTIEGVAGRGLALAAAALPSLDGNRSCGNGVNLWQPESADAIDTAGNEICEDAPAE